MIELDTIYNEDCLTGMQRIPDGSVDCIICDLPYGTTHNRWDSTIPLDKLWEQYKRIIKSGGAICLFGAEPFTSMLRMSNLEWYRYDWKWQKEQGTGGLNANLQPLRDYEDIAVFSDCPAVFCKKPMRYNPQLIDGKPYKITRPPRSTETYNAARGGTFYNEGKRYPKSIIQFKRDSGKVHPTQKPVDLIAYLIRTYSNPGDTILDNTIGSGTTAVAALREKRHFIGFELNRDYYDIALRRIKLEQQQQTLF